MRSSSIGCRSNWNLPQVVIFIWSHSIVVNIGACHASVESSILSGTAKFSRCCSQRPCYKFRVEALISQDSRFNWHRVTSVGLRPFFANRLCSRRLEAQDIALSRRVHRFESGRERQCYQSRRYTCQCMRQL